MDLTLDNAGNLFVSDWGSNMIYKITPSESVTIAVGHRMGTMLGPLPASLNRPYGVAVNPITGDLYLTADNAVLKSDQ
jgi:DNA-binding beta-propeller fold protein YncE